MLVCSTCSRDNPPDVLFCIGCGSRLAAVSPPAQAAYPPAVPVAVAGRSMPAVSGGSGELPAYRPFGIVFLMVMGFITGYLMLIIGPLALYGSGMLFGAGRYGLGEMALGFAGVGGGTPVLGILLGLLILVGGLLSITGAVGLWIRAQWGRQTISGVQGVGIIVGLALLAASANRAVSYSGASGIIAMLGALVIAYSIAVILYLNRSQMDPWFRAE